MNLTIDNCVMISSLKDEADSDESRAFLDRIGQAPEVVVFEPVVYLLETFLVVPRTAKQKGIALDKLASGRGISPEFVEVTLKDAFDFIPTKDPAAQEIVAKVKPAADLLYVIVAQKSGSTLVTLDEALLDACSAVGVQALRPSEVRL